MMHVLFVDDEPKVLMALRRMLHSMSGEWQMGFAGGSEEALQYLSKNPCDVIVTDMRMPGMDGAQLLEAVRAEYPATVRVILSGHSALDRVYSALGPAHQFLSKPCEANRLRATIQRSFALRDRLRDKHLVSIVSRIGTLPAVPSIYGRLLEELDSPNATVHSVGEIMSHDASMTAKVLQLTNSSFFGLPLRITDPIQAVMQLGLERIRSLVVAVGAFCQFESEKVSVETLERLMDHCSLVGTLASRIATTFDNSKQFLQDVFAAGMLHDIGILVLMVYHSEPYREVRTFARSKNLPLWQAERQLLGATHAEVGAYLMNLWGLPDPIVEAIAWHHEPSNCPGTEFSPLTAVHVANTLLPRQSPLNPPHKTPEPDIAYLGQLQLLDRLTSWKELASELEDEMAAAK